MDNDEFNLGCIIALLRMVFRSPSDLLSLSKVKDAVFAQFWQRMGNFFLSSFRVYFHISIHL